MKYHQCLLWVDIETTSLPVGNNFDDVHILEFACILTGFDLKPVSGYREIIKPTKSAIEVLRVNPEVLQMHKANNLLEELKTASATVTEVEQEVIKILKEKTTFEKGEFMLAGSGVAGFDHPLIKEKMPELASWLTYYTMDIGVYRRTTSIFGGRHDFWNPVQSSYQSGVKNHRAYDDLKAHLEEASRIFEWLRGLK